MKQTEAVDVIMSLLPEMKKSAAEDVLTKYATSKNLSPAQLERLGHVFNTASTLQTLESDRSGVPYLLEVPKMVRSYIDSTGSRKSASFLTPEVAPEVTQEVKTAAELPNVWGRKPETLDDLFQVGKQAADKTPLQKRAFFMAMDLAETAIETELAETSKFASEIVHLAKTIVHQNDLDKLANLRADIKALSSEAESEIVANKLAGALSGMGVDVRSGSAKTSDPFVLARDRTGYFPQVEGALKHLKLAMEANASLNQVLTVANEMGELLKGDWRIENEARKRAAYIQNLAEVSGIIKVAGPDKKKDQEETFESNAEEVENVLRGLHREDVSPRYDTAYRPDHLIGPALGTAFYGGLEAMRTTRESLQSSIPSYLTAFSPEGAVGQYLAPLGERNREKVKGMALNRTQIAEDTRSAAMLKRLMITDEILSTKDPERVFEAFQSIRQASPEVAQDPSMLRLLLRQAMETQGMDIDSATAARKYEHGSYRSDASKSRILY